MQSPYSATSPSPAEHRRDARQIASWPVTVQTGDRQLRLHAVNVSAHGVKVSLNDRMNGQPLEVGRAARLRIEPPGAWPVEVDAIVWRTDEDGPAFFFVGPRSSVAPSSASS
jgi:hypothetical protein